jgi:hypothetical protein
MMLMRMRGRGSSVRLCFDVSLSCNGFGAEGGSAIAGALPHLSSLTTLEYVGSKGGVWFDCDATGTQGVAHEWAVGDTLDDVIRRCEVGVCGMVARVCALCCVLWCAASVCGLDVGCDAMMRESGCEAVRVGGGGGVCG